MTTNKQRHGHAVNPGVQGMLSFSNTVVSLESRYSRMGNTELHVYTQYQTAMLPLTPNTFGKLFFFVQSTYGLFS